MGIVEVFGWFLAVIAGVFVLTIAAFCISYAISYGWNAGGKQGMRRG
ncbi:MAG: hypothetical protein RSB98_00895 [Raoultibacter sp.]